MTKVIDVLSKVSGVPTEDVNKILEDVKANRARLGLCSGPHDFVAEGEGIRKVMRCRLCQGTIKVSDFYWYQKGLEHGRKG